MDASLPPLNPQQLRFVREYLIDPSVIKAAAIRAGYSIETAGPQASRLLKDPRVILALQTAQSEAQDVLNITAARVLQELWKVAGANPGDVLMMDEEGNHVLDPSKAAEVFGTVSSDGSGKKVKQLTSKTVKPSDKIAALGLVAKLLDIMPKEKVEVSGTVNWTDVLEASYKDVTEIKQPDVPLLEPKAIDATPLLEDKPEAQEAEV